MSIFRKPPATLSSLIVGPLSKAIVFGCTSATPAGYPIIPPVADPRNWLYAVSVQNRDNRGTIVTILDVGESQEPVESGLPLRQRGKPVAAWRLERRCDSMHIRS